MSFCARFSFSPYPLCEDTLQLFTTYLAKSLSYASIRTYLSSLRLAQVELGLSPAPEMHRLKLLLRGVKRVKGARSKAKRKPITLALLETLKRALRSSSFSIRDQTMLWAAFTTAFFGFLRASDFCAASQSTFDQNSTLLVKDAAVSPDLVVLRLKSSKTDQFRKGFEVRLAASGKSVCPYRALLEHLQYCHNPNVPLFSFSYGSYLTRQTLSDILKSLLPPSYDQRAYSSHSFRIGAATSAASKQTPVWLIKALGRWSSNCFEDYIRVPSTTIDAIPPLLAQPL